jgi:hypothetical protein
LMPGAQRGHQFRHRLATGRADDISNKQNSHRRQTKQ